MNLWDEIKRLARSIYWWWKDRHIIEKLCDNPESYLVYVPKDNDKVGVDVFIRSGISIEQRDNFGVGHLLEHYLSESASREHQSEFYMNGRINHEMMNLYARIDRDKPARTIETFLDKIFRVRFDDETMLDYEKLAIQNELNTDSHNLGRRIERIVETGRFAGECFCIKSFEDSIEPTSRLSMEDIQGHARRIMNRQNVRIFISCYAPARSFKSYLKGLLSGYALPDGRRSEYPACSYSGQKIEHLPDPQVTGSYVYLTFPALRSTDSSKDKIVMRMALDLLTGREEAYSVNKRARRAGIYSVNSYWVRMEQIGFIAFYSYIPADRHAALLSILGDSLKAARTRSVSKKYLKKEVRDLANIYRREWRSNDRTNWVIDEMVDHGRFERLDYYLDILKSITAEDVRAMAERIFDLAKLNLYIYGDQPTTEDAELLAKLSGGD